jgi:catechol-2,3-dioxygenase
MGTFEDLQAMVAHLRAHGVEIRRTRENAHSVGVYFSDPDGHGLEVYYEEPGGYRRAWEGRFARQLEDPAPLTS